MLIKTVFLFVLFLNAVESEENIFVINGKKSINTVNEEFLSYSIDLNNLLEGLNNSFSNAFAAHLSPAFLRIADLNNELISLNNLDKWKLLREWFRNNRLTPIFTINNKNAGYKLWDSKDLVQFLDHNNDDTAGDVVHWQMLYGCDYKTPIKYKEDVMLLKYVLDMYSPSKVISDNLHSCKNADANLLTNTIRDLEGIVDAYMWDFPYTKHDLGTKSPTWIAMPKSNRLGFQYTLQWFKRLGEAAKSYNVVFWQGDFNIFNDTPIFWMSFLFKKLLGKTVLDLSTTATVKPGIEVSAHCGKERQGAMVISIVNTGNQDFFASVQLDNNNPHLNHINVQKYILASPNNEFTYLNGKRLTTDILKEFIEPEPIINYGTVVELTVPAQALGIFVLPDANIPVCVNQQDSQLTPRAGINSKPFNFNVLKTTLDDLNKVQKKNEIKNEETSNEFRRFLVNKVKHNKPTKLEIVFTEQPLNDQSAQHYTRHIELQLTNDEIKKILMDRAKALAAENDIKTTDKQLEVQMARAARRMVKRNNAEKQKIKRFAMNPKRRPNLKKRNKRNVLRRKNVKNEKARDLIADLAPVKGRGKNDESFEEEVLKSGEKYLDERVHFLKGAGVDSGVDDGAEYYHGLMIENYGNKDRIKRQTTEELSIQDVLANKKSGPLQGPNKVKHRFEIVGSRRKTDARLLKEKIGNRKKMNDWIRARRNKHTARAKRSVLAFDEVYTPKAPNTKLHDSYVSQVPTNKWKPEDLQLIKKEPSYSTEDLNEWEFFQSPPALRKPRNTFVDDNTIEDHILNKIRKKMLYKLPTVTSATNSSNTQSFDKFNITVPSIVSTEVTTNNKMFFNRMVDSIRDFIETVYGNVSNYFIG